MYLPKCEKWRVLYNRDKISILWGSSWSLSDTNEQTKTETSKQINKATMQRIINKHQKRKNISELDNIRLEKTTNIEDT